MDEKPSEFQLCSYCRERQGAEGPALPLASEDVGCYVCRGMSSDLDGVTRKTLATLRRFEFKTFSIGLVLPQGVQDREDTLRSELKIRGRETIKSEVAGRVAAAVAKGMRGRRVDRLRPDVTALVDIGQGTVSVNSKPLFLYGRYTKPRGVAQRRLYCAECNGRGCERCKGTGYSSAASVEGLVSGRLERLVGSKRFKFTWFGSEDPESAVFPPGRPVLVESKNPRKRRAPRTLRLRTRRGGVSVLGLRSVNEKLEHPAFTFMTRATIRAERRVSQDEVKKLQREMRNATVQYRNNKGRLVDKRVYFVRATASGRRITAEIKLDGGLPVKRFVSGDAVSPSFAESMGVGLACERFDILRVWPKAGTGA